MSANVVNFAYAALVDDQVDCFAVVGYMKPVTYIFTGSVYRKLFIC